MTTIRTILRVVTAHRQTEGAGFTVRRPEDYQTGRMGEITRTARIDSRIP